MTEPIDSKDPTDSNESIIQQAEADARVRGGGSILADPLRLEATKPRPGEVLSEDGTFYTDEKGNTRATWATPEEAEAARRVHDGGFIDPWKPPTIEVNEYEYQELQERVKHCEMLIRYGSKRAIAEEREKIVDREAYRQKVLDANRDGIGGILGKSNGIFSSKRTEDVDP